jgi:hypothetical protein
MPSLAICNNLRSTFQGCVNLRLLDLSSLNALGILESFSDCKNLIDLRLGELYKDTSLSSWSPSVALLADSQSLLYQEDLNNGFTSNLHKLLYNSIIRLQRKARMIL